jgi:uncharacterized membrane protein YgdD (TMEM256/DUF423 family)
MQSNKTIAWASVVLCIGVILGALGAHALEKILDEKSLRSFETAVRYQLIHGLAILILGFSEPFRNGNFPKFISNLFFTGIAMFSGSIYLLLFLKNKMIAYPSIMGLITPLGGVLFILAWSLMAIHFFKKTIK